jgi:KDO2-lipid IV(A) lauroyltransferase
MGARAAEEFPLSVVARPNSNSGVQQYIDNARMNVGIKVISKFDTGRASIGILRQNKTLGILPDQHAGPDGLLLPFFGHPTRFVSSLARIALLSGAPVVPAFGVRRKPWLANGRIVAIVFPALQLFNAENNSGSREERVVEGTRQVIARLEEVITDYPDQWLWMPRRWRAEDAEAFEAASQA